MVVERREEADDHIGATVLMTLVKLLGSFAQAKVKLTPTKGKTPNTVFPGLGRGFTHR
jgi:hypothetical protein